MGMMAALIASSIWLNVATYFGQPVSTTHAIIGAVIGFAIVAAGVHAVVWSNMGTIAASWVVSPLVGGALAFIVYKLVQKYVLSSRHPVFMARRALPICFGAVSFLISLSVFYSVLRVKGNALVTKVPLAALCGLAVALGARAVLARKASRLRVRRSQRYAVVERWFARIQPITACYMAFAHGANDVANAIGPLAGIFHYAGGGTISDKAPVPLWLLALGGAGIVIGLSTYGYKVMAAIGKKITEITPTRGFAAEFGTASTVLVCSLMGLPISTTFVLVGAVMGVGVARGFGAIDLGVVRKIFASWLITIPVSAVLSAGIYGLLMRFV
jgi:PiT family inorganic phosphate transporter